MRAIDDARPNIPLEVVRAHEVILAWGRELGACTLIIRAEGRNRVRKCGKKQDRQNDQCADDENPPLQAVPLAQPHEAVNCCNQVLKLNPDNVSALLRKGLYLIYIGKYKEAQDCLDKALKLDPNLPDIVGSEDQLHQAFINFISNAAESMEAAGDGVLKIKTQLLLADDKIKIEFKDNGVGIPQKNVSKLFEPFFTTKSKGKGVGLGLSVAYGIIEEHGGSIHVDSKEGKGATFNIKLPLKQLSFLQNRNGGVNEQH